jgi:transcriptional regulator with XRE-family HTH domain
MFHERLARNIRNARKAAGMTQEQLAQRIGLTKNSVSFYENAKRMPSIETMSIMRNVLETSLDDLVPEVRLEVEQDPSQTSIYDMIGE